MFFTDDRAAPSESICRESNKIDEHYDGAARTASGQTEEDVLFPPGLIGEVAQFFLDQAPYPNRHIALAGSIGFLCGICGRSFNTNTGAGLNQYILVLAFTGSGKEAIADGIAKLMAAIQPSVPAVLDFKGPGHFASAPALLKALANTPCFVSVIGEFGLKLKALASARANPNDLALKAALLELYSKSGQGKLLDALAYSDREKNTLPVHSPAFTLVGESTPETFAEAVDERVVADGLLPRFAVFLAPERRPYMNACAITVPPPSLIQALANLAATCLQRAHNHQTLVVPADAEATAWFAGFDRWTTDRINEGHSEASRQLWNRANLKAIKLAALCAVGINPHSPVVTANEAMWATRLIASQTEALLARFANGDVGEVAGNQAKQQQLMRKVIREYMNAPIGKYELSGCKPRMHELGIFSQKYLSDRLIKLAAFRGDKAGGTGSLKRTIDFLLESDEIRRVSTPEMMKQFGTGALAFGLTNQIEFMARAE